MWINPQKTADLFSFTKEIFSEIFFVQSYIILLGTVTWRDERFIPILPFGWNVLRKH